MLYYWLSGSEWLTDNEPPGRVGWVEHQHNPVEVADGLLGRKIRQGRAGAER